MAESTELLSFWVEKTISTLGQTMLKVRRSHGMQDLKQELCI